MSSNPVRVNFDEFESQVVCYITSCQLLIEKALSSGQTNGHWFGTEACSSWSGSKDTWAPVGGGGKSRRSPPPPGKLRIFFGYMVRPFCYLFSICGPLYYIFLLMWGPFSPCEGPFRYFFLHVEGLFCLYGRPLFSLPPPTKISAGAYADTCDGIT